MKKFDYLKRLNSLIIQLCNLVGYYGNAPETSVLVICTTPKEIGHIGNMMIDNLDTAVGYEGNPTSVADAIARKMRSDVKFAAYMITVIDLIKLSGKMPDRIVTKVKKDSEDLVGDIPEETDNVSENEKPGDSISKQK